MKHIKSRLTSLILAILMVLGTFSAFPAVVTVAETFENYTYIVKDDGTAEITKYTEVEGDTNPVLPSKINGYTVTSIGDYAFANCENLESISLMAIENPGDDFPEIKSIGEYAFSGCTSLEYVYLYNVESLGAYAFSGCSSLAEIGAFEYVKSIKAGTFDGCTSLTTATIMSKNTTIEDGVFDDCENLTIMCNSPSYASNYAYVNNIPFEIMYYLHPDYIVKEDGTAEIVNCAEKVTGYFEIPEYVGEYEYIYDEDGNFEESIPIVEYAVTSIGDYAFANCPGLTEIGNYADLTSIGAYAFSGCSSLTLFDGLPGDVTIGAYAFSGCSSLTDIDISEVTIIGENAFEGTGIVVNTSTTSTTTTSKTSTSTSAPVTKSPFTYTVKDDDTIEITGCNDPVGDIEIPEEIDGYTVTSIGESAFSEDMEGPTHDLISVILPDTITSIGAYAFSGCYNLTSINFPESSSLISIGDSAFYYCSSLTAIDLPDSLTSIGIYALSSCSALTEIVIPDSVTDIGSEAFRYSGLTSVTLPENENFTSISYGLFQGCSELTEITIPDSVTSISDVAFSYCTALESIILPAGIIVIGETAFSNCENLTISGYSNSVAETYAIENGIPFVSIGDLPVAAFTYTVKEDDTIEITRYTEEEGVTDIIVPEEIDGYTVTSIGVIAFSEAHDLISVTLPDTITSIGDYAFANCPGLTEINLPESLISIGERAFYRCFSLTEINIPEGVTSIGDYAFENCSSLIAIEIPESVTSIGDYAFVDSPVTIYGTAGSYTQTYAEENGIPFIDDDLPVADFTYTVKEDDTIEITGCNDPVGDIEIPEEIDGYVVTSLASGVFSGCYELTSITLPDTLTSLGAINTFYSCYSLTEIVIPEGITSIGLYTFYNCTSLSSITIPESVTSIGEGAFEYCTDLTISGYSYSTAHTYAIDNNITFESIGTVAIKYVYTVKDDGTAEITGYTGGATGDIEIPEEIDGYVVTSLASNAFRGCSEMTSIILPNTLTSLGDEGTFYDCTSLTEIVIPEGITSIGYQLFAYCTGLSSIIILESVTSIDGDAFYQCSEDLTIWGYTNSIVHTFALDNGIEFIEIGTVAPNYTVKDDGTAEITGFPGRATGDIEIPEEIDGYTVTSLASGAFSGCSELTSIILPDTLTSLGAINTFYGCIALTEIVIPEGVTSIGLYTFYNCTSLSSITIPESVTSIGEGAFEYCEGLTISGYTNSIVHTFAVDNGIEFIEIGTVSRPNYIVKEDGTAEITGFPGRATGDIEIPDEIDGYVVTSLASNAFRGCSDMTSIILPDTLTSLGDESTFYDCTSLTEIVIPEGVTSIGYNMFAYCFALSSVTIPESVVSIDSDAFYQCVDFTILGYTNSIVHTFALDNGIEFIEIGTVGPIYIVKDDGTAEITGFPGRATGDIEIPEEIDGYVVTSLASGAFSGCSELTSIILPSTLTSLGAINTFYGCTSLTEIVIPDSVTSIGIYTFYNCTSLSSVTIPESVISIGEGAFDYCEELTISGYRHSVAQTFAYSNNISFAETGISLPNYIVKEDGTAEIIGFPGKATDEAEIPDEIDGYIVTSIGEKAFENCTDLVFVTLPDTITSIGNNAFKGCSALTSINIPDSVTSIGDEGTFSGCSSLIEIIIPSGITEIGYQMFYGCAVLISATIPETVTAIDSSAFGLCTELSIIGYTCSVAETFAIDNDIPFDSIGVSPPSYKVKDDGTAEITGFPGRASGDIEIPAEIDGYVVTSIGANAFEKSSGLESITLPDTLKSIGNRAFKDCSLLTSIEIPYGVTSIGDMMFYYCSALTSITIPETVNSIDTDAFTGCTELMISGKTFSYAESFAAKNNIYFDDLGPALPNYIVKEDGTAEIVSYYSKPSGKIDIPAELGGYSVTSIGANAFEDCVDVTSISLPVGLISIGDYAFSGCTALTSIDIPEGVTSIGEYAFDGGAELADVIFPDTLIEIGDYAFYTCWLITSLSLPENLETIGTGAFQDCSALTEVVIPDSVTAIGDYAFGGCTQLTDATVSSGLTSLSLGLFQSGTSLVSVTLPDSITTINTGAFKDCTSLTEITLSENVTSIERQAFEGCTALTSITIPSDVTSIGVSAFDGCENLIIKGHSGSIAEEYANENSITFESLDAPVSPFTYELSEDGTITITGYTGEETDIEIPAEIDEYTVTAIGVRAFAENWDLTSVILPDTITSIGSNAFLGCSALTSINIPENVTSINEYTFRYCIDLTSITIPESVTFIGESAFESCDKLTISGYANSIVHTFAVDNDIPFTAIGTIKPNYTVKEDGTAEITGFLGRAIGDVEIPAEVDGYVVTSLAAGAFKDCPELTSIILPDTLTSIGDKNTFANCTSLTEIVIPEGVTSIGLYTFENCTALTSVTIPESVTSIETLAFYECDNFTITGYKGSYAETFANASKITFIAIDNTPETPDENGRFFFDTFESDIGEWINRDDAGEVTVAKATPAKAYYGTGALLVSGRTATWMGTSHNLNSLAFVPGGIYKFGGAVMSPTDDTNFMLSIAYSLDGEELYENIYSDYAAAGEWLKLEGIVEIPIGATDVIVYFETEYYETDGEGNLTDFYLDNAYGGVENAVSPFAYDYVLLGDDTIAITGYTGEEAEIVIPAEINGYTVTTIAVSAFEGCTSLTSIKIPDSITLIDNYAFFDCINLTSFIIGSKDTDFGLDVFGRCHYLTIFGVNGSSAQSYALIWDIPFALISEIDEVAAAQSQLATLVAALKIYIDPEYAEFTAEYGLDIVTIAAGFEAYVNSESLEELSEKIAEITAVKEEIDTAYRAYTITTSPGTGTTTTRTGTTTTGTGTTTKTVTTTDITNEGDYIVTSIIPGDVWAVTSVVSVEERVVTSVVSGGYYGVPATSVVVVEVVPVEVSDGVTVTSVITDIWTVTSLVFVPDQVVTSVVSSGTRIVTSIVSEPDRIVSSIVRGTTTTTTSKTVTTTTGTGENTGTGTATSAVSPFIYEVLYDDKITIEGYTGTDTEIVIPTEIDGYTVIMISYEAFKNLSNITGVIIPEGIITIGESAFEGCYNLTSITFPASLQSVGGGIFAGDVFLGCTSLAEINVSEDSYYYADIDGVLFNKDLTEILLYPPAKTDEQYSIPNTVDIIGNSAFENCINLVSVEIPVSVTAIGDYAFANCSSIVLLQIPESVRMIGVGAFLSCSSLVTITIPEDVAVIPDDAFAYCSDLALIKIPESVVEIGENVFAECDNLTISGYKGSYAETYAEENGIKFSEIGGSVGTTDYTYTVSEDGTIKITGYTGTSTAIEIPSVIDGYAVTAIGDYAFESCSDLVSVIIPEGVTSIGYGAFGYCSSLVYIELPDSLTSIDSSAFVYCTKLTGITIPEGVSSIGESVFEYCLSLSSINVSVNNEYYSSIDGVLFNKDATQIISYPIGKKDTSYTIPESVTSIATKAFSGCSALTAITIPEGVVSIGYGAFENCSALTSLTIPSTVTDISDDVFSGCSKLEEILVGEDSLNYTSEDGVLYNKEKTAIICYPPGKSVSEYTIPDGVTSIADRAFYNWSNLVTVTIPDSVKSIGEEAFYGCTKLTTVIIPETVTSIGDWAFAYCSSLKDITLPESIKSVGKNVFFNCKNLESITVGSSLTDFSFIPSSVKTINISDGSDMHTIIDDVLFSKDMTQLIKYPKNKQDTEYVIPDGVTSIADSAFENCLNLTSIIIPESVTEIGKYAFYGCSNLTDLIIPSSVTSIGCDAFEYCSSLTEISLPDGITVIEDYLFNGCSSLTSIDIPDSVTSIGDNAFANCSALISITLPEGITSIGNSAFYRCSSLNEIILPSTLVSIGINAFESCSSLTYLTIPEGVTSIGTGAFWYCENLVSVTIPESIEVISDYAFYNCTKLTSVTISYGVTAIGTNAFCGCTSLISLDIPDSVTSIGEYSVGYLRDRSGTYKSDDFTVYGFAGTAAEDYALANELTFAALDVEPTEIVVSKLYDDGTDYVNSDDLNLLTDLVSGNTSAELNSETEKADVYKDGTLNSNDITILKAYLVKQAMKKQQQQQ